MKKQILMLCSLVLLLAGCGQKQGNPSQNNAAKEKTETQEMTLAAQYDLLYVEEGNIWLYKLDTHEADRYNSESDSIIHLICSKNNVLYYNVVKDDRLVLKCLDLNTADPEPEQLIDWDVPVNVGEYYYPQQYGNMYFNYEGTQIALERDVNWFAGMYYNLGVYDLASQTVKTYELYRTVNDEEGLLYLEDLPDESGFNRWGPSNTSLEAEEPRFVIGDQVYYVGDGNNTCLTDQIDFKKGFGFDYEDGFELDVCGTDPTGNKALMAAHMYMGDGEIGFYIVSSLDGKMQMELPGSSYGETDPQWLPDGSLLFPGYIDGVGLFLLEPNNNLRFIAESDIFCVLH